MRVRTVDEKDGESDLTIDHLSKYNSKLPHHGDPRATKSNVRFKFKWSLLYIS
jgi:hypothetical protein